MHTFFCKNTVFSWNPENRKAFSCEKLGNSPVILSVRVIRQLSAIAFRAFRGKTKLVSTISFIPHLSYLEKSFFKQIFDHISDYGFLFSCWYKNSLVHFFAI